MTAKFFTLALILAFFAPPVAAETTYVNGCPLSGPTDDASSECLALRVTYREAVLSCMEDRAAAQSRVTPAPSNSAPAARARMLICQDEATARMGVVE